MRRNSHGVPERLIALATLLALALTLLVGGVASASTVTVSRQAASPVAICIPPVSIIPSISASPLSQIVGVKQTAWVKVSVNCSPTLPVTYVRVRWGDGIIEYYPIMRCLEVCHLPPFIINTSHAYTRVGLYHPLFCLVQSPIIASLSFACTTVKILVVILDPPAA